MSTNHTPNYNLCQWEDADQVLRSDFNQDNAKIDAALKGIGQIHTFERAYHSNAYSFDLEDIDWTQWILVGVTLYVPYNTNTNSFMACVVDSFSGRAKAFCSGDSVNFAHMGNTSSVLILTPFHDPEREVCGVYVGPQSGIGFAECKYSDIKYLNLGGGGGGSFIESHATLWGVK